MKRRSFITVLATLPFVVASRRVMAALAEVRHRPANIAKAVKKQWAERPVVLFAIGDWGAGGSIQRKVAKSMQDWAAASTTEYPSKPVNIVSTGDNIYPNGVDSENDPQWATKFENVYTGSDIQVQWLSVLGNHDYRKNPDAQVAYSKKNPKWFMPGRTWSKSVGAESDIKGRNPSSKPVTQVLVCALDTQAMLTRAEGWQRQVEWLDRELGASDCKWKIVVGHHPIRSYGHYGDQNWMLSSIKPILARHGVQLYLCGHDHDMQVIRHPDDTFTCVVSGNGGGARNTVWGEHTKFAYADGGFASLICGERELEVQVVGIDAQLLYSGVIT